MRISEPFSRNSAAIIMALLAATAALGQDSPRREIEKKGPEALERLKGAVSRQEQAAGKSPASIILPRPGSAERQRAFDGLRRRLPNAAMESRARAAITSGEEGLAAQREAQAKRLRQAFGLEPGEEKALAGAVPATSPKAWMPVLFVSSSMPVPILRSYAAQLQRVHGVMAFRGMPGGLRKVAPMAKLTAEILRLDPGCEGPSCTMRDVQVIVDPIVFRQHGVARVPALAMIPGDPTQAYCERDEESPRARHIVYGDSALPGLLDEYARLGGREEVRDAQALVGAR